MQIKLLLLPVFGLIVQTYFVLLWMARRRFQSVKRGDLKGRYFVYNRGETEPGYLAKVTGNFHNLLQLPLLFYAVVALILITQQLSWLLIVCAWLYWVLRIVHTVIHTTYNNVMHRFYAFASSSVILGIMWISLAISVISK